MPSPASTIRAQLEEGDGWVDSLKKHDTYCNRGSLETNPGGKRDSRSLSFARCCNNERLHDS